MMNLSERTEIRREMEADRRGKEKKKLNCADFGKWEDRKGRNVKESGKSRWSRHWINWR